MAAGIPARLTVADGRRFGLTVGAAFIALAGILAWRGYSSAPKLFAIAGSALILLGIAIPERLGPLFSAWMRLAHAISRVTTPLVMGVIYFVVLTPTGVVMRLLVRNPVAPRRDPESAWVAHDPRSEADGAMRRQF